MFNYLERVIRGDLHSPGDIALIKLVAWIFNGVAEDGIMRIAVASLERVIREDVVTSDTLRQMGVMPQWELLAESLGGSNIYAKAFELYVVKNRMEVVFVRNISPPMSSTAAYFPPAMHPACVIDAFGASGSQFTWPHPMEQPEDKYAVSCAILRKVAMGLGEDVTIESVREGRVR